MQFSLLPVSHHEVLSHILSEICLRAQMKVARNPRHKPDFSKAFHHIAVHPGARVVIDRIATVRGPRAYRNCGASGRARAHRPHCLGARSPRVLRLQVDPRHMPVQRSERVHIKAGRPVYNTTLSSGKPNTVWELKPCMVPCTAERGAYANLTRPGLWCAHDP